MQITQCSWNGSSPLQRVDIRKLSSGGIEAYIHAPEGAGAGQLASVPALLKAKGFDVVTDQIDGRDVLRVTGAKNEEAFFQSLQENGLVVGAPATQKVGEKDKISFVQKVRQKSINLNGIAGLVGHAALAVSGALEKDYKRVATAGFYGASTSLYAFKGAGGDPNGEFRKLVDDMRGHLEQQGVPIPQGADLTAAELNKKGGVVETVTKLFNEKPLEVGTGIGIAGNIYMMMSGLKDPNGRSPGRIMSGLCALIAGLSIVLVKPKDKSNANTPEAWGGQAPQPEAEAKGIKKITNWVQEKPFQFAGLMFMGSNLSMLQAARQTQKSYKDDTGPAGKSYLFAYTTAAAYMVATFFTSISTKEKTSDFSDREILSKLCAYSANIIAAQPDDIRQGAIESMAAYLETQPKVTLKKEEIAKEINEKVDQLSTSPWVAKMAAQDASQAAAVSAGRG